MVPYISSKIACQLKRPKSDTNFQVCGVASTLLTIKADNCQECRPLSLPVVPRCKTLFCFEYKVWFFTLVLKHGHLFRIYRQLTPLQRQGTLASCCRFLQDRNSCLMKPIEGRADHDEVERMVFDALQPLFDNREIIDKQRIFLTFH